MPRGLKGQERPAHMIGIPVTVARVAKGEFEV